MKPSMLLGEAPSRHFTGCAPFMSLHCMRNLDRLFVNPHDWRSSIERVNLLDHPQERSGAKGDKFDTETALRVFARMSADGRFTDRRMLIAGKRLAWCILRRRVSECFIEFDFMGSMWMVIQHPTGINRWWNDDAAVRNASTLVRRFLS